MHKPFFFCVLFITYLFIVILYIDRLKIWMGQQVCGIMGNSWRDMIKMETISMGGEQFCIVFSRKCDDSWFGKRDICVTCVSALWYLLMGCLCVSKSKFGIFSWGREKSIDWTDCPRGGAVCVVNVLPLCSWTLSPLSRKWGGGFSGPDRKR